MKTIRLSDDTYRALRSFAIFPFQDTGQRQPDGDWLVPISDDTWERLEQHRLAGESDDDIVGRLIRFAQGRRPD